MKIRLTVVLIHFLLISCLTAACREVAAPIEMSASGPRSEQSPTPAVDRSLLTDTKPGRSLGPIALGDKFDTVLETRPFKKNTDSILESSKSWYNGVEYTSPKEYRWISVDEISPDIYFYFFENDKVFQIETRSRRYKLNNGLGVGSSIDEVFKVFPVAQRFKIDFRQPPRPGYDEESYLVYQTKGLAFQITSEFDGSHPEVTMVIVFLPEREFLPRGCVIPRERYIKLS